MIVVNTLTMKIFRPLGFPLSSRLVQVLHWWCCVRIRSRGTAIVKSEVGEEQ
jgi:hypothetical protein